MTVDSCRLPFPRHADGPLKHRTAHAPAMANLFRRYLARLEKPISRLFAHAQISGGFAQGEHVGVVHRLGRSLFETAKFFARDAKHGSEPFLQSRTFHFSINELRDSAGPNPPLLCKVDLTDVFFRQPCLDLSRSHVVYSCRL